MSRAETTRSFSSAKLIGVLCFFMSCAIALAAQELSAPDPVQSISPNAAVDVTARAMDSVSNIPKDSIPQLTYRIPRGSERYLLGPGDTVLITVFRYPELSRAVRIEGDGMIRVPLIHADIHASCLTTDQLAEEVAKHYLEYLKDPQVDVSIRDYSSEPVAVVGAVNKPGSFALQRRVRLREILAFAGGPSPAAGRLVQIMHDEADSSGCAIAPTSANKEEDALNSAAPTTSSAAPNGNGAVPKDTANPDAASRSKPATSTSNDDSRGSDAKAAEVTNSTGPVAPASTAKPVPAPGITYVDLVELMQGGGTDPYIRPGDIINVPEASSAFVVGDVNHPTVVPLNKQIMLSRAIALAGGPTANASSKVRIVRYIDTKGGNTEIVVNLKDIYSNKREDVALRAGDIVQVPGSTAKSLTKAIMWLGAWWSVYNAYNIIQ